MFSKCLLEVIKLSKKEKIVPKDDDTDDSSKSIHNNYATYLAHSVFCANKPDIYLILSTVVTGNYFLFIVYT
jgi:hypothetical protein